MSNKIIITGLLILFVKFSMAQSPYYRPGGYPPNRTEHERADTARSDSAKKGFDPHKLVFGGNIGLLFGNETYIELSPLIGYKFTERFTAGLGPKYQYYRIKGVPGIPDYSDQIYGGRVFGQYRLFNNVMAYAEYELVSTSYQVYSPAIGDFVPQRSYVPGLLLGGGYRQPIGNKSSFTIYILYNVLYQENVSPYPSALVFTGGFLF